MQINFFNQIWEVFSHLNVLSLCSCMQPLPPSLSSPPLSSSTFSNSETPFYAFVDMLNGISQVSEALFIFLIFFFSFLSECILSFDLSSILQILSFVSSNLLLIPFNQFFNSVIVLSIPKFFKKISISIEMINLVKFYFRMFSFLVLCTYLY